MLPAKRKLTPVTLLTGFLGAGKTTLLNRILTGDTGQRFAVLVNDFGNLNIDKMLIQNNDGDVITLEGGCVCCLMKADLVNSLLQIISLHPDHILIEASGVANPYGLLQTLKRQVLTKIIRLDSVISVVDITCLPAICEANEAINYQDLLMDQITVADIVIVNKVDLADETEKATAVKQLHKIAPWARLLECSYAQVPLDLLLGFHDARAFRPAFAPIEIEHSSQFQTWSFQSERPFVLQKLKKQLSELPTTVLRVKGILFSVEHPEQRVILQQVGVRVTLETGESWGNTAGFSQLVLIAIAGTLNKTVLQQYFENCLIPETTMA